MKRILFLLEDYPAYGGIEGVTTQLANRLLPFYSVIICSHHQKDEGILAGLDKRVILFSLPDKSTRISQKNIDFFNTILTENSVTTIIYQDSYYPNEYLLNNIRNRDTVKIIVAEHNSPQGIQISFLNRCHSLKWWQLIKWLKTLLHYRNVKRAKERRTHLYQIADIYVLLSESIKKEFFDYSYITDSSKLYTIGNFSVFGQKKVNFLVKKKECLFVGRLDVMKGIDRLIRIWEKTSEKLPDWELVVVGDGVKMSDIKEQQQSGILKKIRIEGFKSNIVDYYESAQAFLMCSTFEGFPLVIPEAMSRGCVPFLFNSFSAAKDLVNTGVNGYIIPAFNEDFYVEKLVGLLKDSTKLHSMQRNAIRDSSRFEIDSIVKKWIDLIEKKSIYDNSNCG